MSSEFAACKVCASGSSHPDERLAFFWPSPQMHLPKHNTAVFPTRVRFISTVVDPVIGLRKRRTIRLLAAVVMSKPTTRLLRRDTAFSLSWQSHQPNGASSSEVGKWPIRFRFVKGLRRSPAAHFVSELPRVQFHSETVSRNCPCPFRSICRESVPKSASILLSYCRFSSAS